MPLGLRLHLDIGTLFLFACFYLLIATVEVEMTDLTTPSSAIS